MQLTGIPVDNSNKDGQVQDSLITESLVSYMLVCSFFRLPFVLLQNLFFLNSAVKLLIAYWQFHYCETYDLHLKGTIALVWRFSEIRKDMWIIHLY